MPELLLLLAGVCGAPLVTAGLLWWFLDRRTTPSLGPIRLSDEACEAMWDVHGPLWEAQMRTRSRKRPADIYDHESEEP